MRLGLRQILLGTTFALTVALCISGCSWNSHGTDKSGEETVFTSTPQIPFEPDPTNTPVPTETPAPTAALLLGKTGSINGLNYSIESAASDEPTKERGYYVFGMSEGDYPVSIMITAGEFSTGGYDIQIADMEYDGTELKITVHETAPQPTDMVTEAFTYPSCAVTLSELPSSITVLDEAGNEFDCLYVYIKEYDIEPGWIAVIEDGAGEILYKTYVYETVDGRYSYINVVATTVSWGSPKWNEIVKGSGFADSREEIVEKAKDFGSSGFVLFPDDTGPDAKAHSIDEFLNG